MTITPHFQTVIGIPSSSAPASNEMYTLLVDPPLPRFIAWVSLDLPHPRPIPHSRRVVVWCITSHELTTRFDSDMVDVIALSCLLGMWWNGYDDKKVPVVCRWMAVFIAVPFLVIILLDIVAYRKSPLFSFLLSFLRLPSLSFRILSVLRQRSAYIALPHTLESKLTFFCVDAHP